MTEKQINNLIAIGKEIWEADSWNQEWYKVTYRDYREKYWYVEICIKLSENDYVWIDTSNWVQRYSFFNTKQVEFELEMMKKNWWLNKILKEYE